MMFYLLSSYNNQMKSTKTSSNSDDDQYDFKTDPKRKNYKKIKVQIKKAMINEFFHDGIGISMLTKKYHLSYSTIAHILKVYKQTNRIFQSKRERKEKKTQLLSSKSPQIKQTKCEDQAQIVKIQTPSYVYYPFFPQWSFLLT